MLLQQQERKKKKKKANIEPENSGLELADSSACLHGTAPEILLATQMRVSEAVQGRFSHQLPGYSQSKSSDRCKP
jgi:hypothetical protein